MKIYDAGLSPLAKSCGVAPLTFTVKVVFNDGSDRTLKVMAETGVHAKLHVFYRILKTNEHNNVYNITWSIESNNPLVIEQANHIPGITCLCGVNDDCNH